MGRPCRTISGSSARAISARTNISASARCSRRRRRENGRKQLVGLSAPAGEAPLPTGAHLVTGEGRARRSLGYVTSSYVSPTLARPVALGLIEDGLSRHRRDGRNLSSRRARRATVAPAVALDPEGARLHA